MKKILFICLVILPVSSLHTYAQKLDTAVVKKTFIADRDILVKKSTKQKTAAWVLLGAGLLSTGLGSVKINPNYGESNSRSSLFLITGLSAIGASIPLFIASSKNKRKANATD